MERDGGWVSAGRIYEMTVEGSVEFAHPRFQAGNRLKITIEGMGEVEGIPENGVMLAGQSAELTAKPEAGWSFDRWEGTFESESVTIELSGEISESLTAIFTQDLALGDTSLVGKSKTPWESTDGGGLFWEGVDSTDLSFEVEGPAIVSFKTYFTDGYRAGLRIDGRSEVSLELDPEGGLESHVLELDSGEHVVELFGIGESASSPLRIGIGDLKVESGYFVTLEATQGGTVEGLNIGTTRIAQETELIFKANPTDEYVFLGWWGDGEGVGDELDLTVEGESQVTAHFGIPLDGELFIAEGEKGSWVHDDEGWTSPSELGAEEVLRIYGKLKGPSHCEISLSSQDGELDIESKIYLDTWGQGRLFTGNTNILVPDGEHLFWIEVKAKDDTVFIPFRIDTPVISYSVYLSVPWGSFASQPALDRIEIPNQHPLWQGRVRRGELLSFEAEGFGEEEFVGWTGDLVGFGEEGSIEVNSQISGVAKYELPRFTTGEVVWEVDRPGSVYNDRWVDDSIALTGESLEVALTATVQGPGMLIGGKYLLESLLVTVDGTEIIDTSSSLAILIDEGYHEVELKLKASSGYPFDWVDNAPGIRSLSFVSGYRVDTKSKGGGSVEVSPQGPFFERGETLTFEAIPNQGAKFNSWSGPYGDRPNPFTIEVQEHMSVDALFSQEIVVDGREWEFEGLASEYFEAWWWEPGYMSWKLVAGDGIQEGSVRGTLLLEENSSVGFKFELPDYIDSLKGEVKVDGEVLEFNWMDNMGWRSLEAGEHVVEMNFEYDGEVFKDYLHRWVRLSLPIYEYSYEVKVLGESIPFEDGLYPAGEYIVLNTPLVDDDGNRFSGWLTKGSSYGQSNWYSYEQEIRLFVDRDIQMQAVYRPFPLELSRVTPRTSFDGNLVVVEGSEGEELVSTEGKVELFAHEDMTIEWMQLQKASNRNWQYKRRFVEKGTSLRIDKGLLLKGFFQSFEWAPNYDSSRTVEVKYDVDTSQVVLDENSTGALVGWIVDGALLPADASIELDEGSNEVVRPVFRGSIATDFGEVALNHESAWGRWSRTGLGEDDFRWRSEIGTGAPLENSIQLMVEGPAFFQFRGYITNEYEGDHEVRLDGENYNIWNVSLGGSVSVGIQIPSGEHELVFIHRGEPKSSFVLEQVELLPGYTIARRVFDGGYLEPAFGAEFTEEGQVVEFVAMPDSGYNFSGWNDGYTGGRRRLIRIGNEKVPEPVFCRIESVEIDGRLWRLDNVKFQMNGSEYLFRGAGALETEIEGLLYWCLSIVVSE
ncbi:hypothetical protein VDG1235_3062 [Verrucomicrobiia bacterium DG1235]|nr:hypothetical protein VDG1235_3062 [Verrucomicrobiae bacterium DG1235]